MKKSGLCRVEADLRGDISPTFISVLGFVNILNSELKQDKMEHIIYFTI